MIGLEYICQCYGKSYNSIAEELGISRQSINGWLKGTRLIPTKHLPKLAEIFSLPEEYFQKELSELEKEEVKGMQITFEVGKIVDLLMEIRSVKEVMKDKSVEEQVDYVELMYIGIIDTVRNIMNRNTPQMEFDDIELNLMSMKKEEDKDIKETIEAIRELMFQNGFDFKKFKQYIKDYK
ncbi:helix-turn-helix domain-containing protein [Clostridium beijerinckii]|uniref:Transcriptional regulator with XRE-family HTH domain n=1 Tax=Clostridium beijerinckii TaxID=1520 RepID=A0AAX0B5I2_CLOBE|nr:helix-turn-helix transcriptional regulator [Clostridium beijerinckii]NRT90207.1 transcriptional regulator with XRE-family HTH domain [Clostridium beijerinckii]NYC69737.1 transcriptional regulator with XRE-family HTH domain [Clostridium beijerinckii]UYZ35388.1 helix-turn-helix domain-containing protein [Clostridium beijerinckii]